MNLNVFNSVISAKSLLIIIIIVISLLYMILEMITRTYVHRKKYKLQLKQNLHKNNKKDTLIYEVQCNKYNCIRMLESKNLYDDREYTFEKLNDSGSYIITFKPKPTEMYASWNTIFEITFMEYEDKTEIELNFIEANGGIRIGFFKKTEGLKYTYWIDEFMIRKLGAKCI